MKPASKKALVTAAGAGIGRSIAARLAATGVHVIACDIDERALAGLDAQGIQLDVTDGDAVRAVVRRVDPVDILVNAAGIVHVGTILDCSEDDWSRALNLNATAMYRLIKAVLPGMISRGGGSIVNIASVASSMIGVPNRFAYGASKAAVIGLTKAVAIDFIGQGIRCNAICPGTVESPSLQQRMRDQARASGESFEAIHARFSARQPVGRLGRPEEIAALAAYLAGDESSFLTGQAIAIDGGWTLQ